MLKALVIFMMSFLVLSCQNEKKNDTKIPPKLSKSKEQSQKDAINYLSDIISNGIDVESNYFKRARINFDIESFQAAFDDINMAIRENQNDSDYFLLRGKINLELKNIDNALQDAERAEALAQTSAELYTLLADIYQIKKSYGKSAAYLNQAIKMAPYNGHIYYVRAMILVNQGDTVAGISNLKEAMHLNPRLIRAYEKATEFNLAKNNIYEALAINNLAINRFPNKPELFYNKGEIYRKIAVYDTAIINYQKAIQLNPKYVPALKNLSQTAISIRAYNDAIVALNNLMTINKDDIATINMLGYAYEKLGNFEKAKLFYRNTLTKFPTNEDARYGMYRIQQRENAYLQGLNESFQSGYNKESSDTSKLKLNIIQPRGTIKLKIDTLKKVKIE